MWSWRVIAITVFVAALSSAVQAKADTWDDVVEAVKNVGREVFDDEIKKASDGEKRRVGKNIERIAKELTKDENKDAAKHVIKEWDGIDDDEDHVYECPICYLAADRLANGTGLKKELDPFPPISTRFAINGAEFVRDNFAYLYRVMIHPLTGQFVLGSAEGFIIFENGQYYGVNVFKQKFAATPLD